MGQEQGCGMQPLVRWWWSGVGGGRASSVVARAWHAKAHGAIAGQVGPRHVIGERAGARSEGCGGRWGASAQHGSPRLSPICVAVYDLMVLLPSRMPVTSK